MKVIYLPRRAGKTTRLAHYVRTHPKCLFIAPNAKMATIIKHDYPSIKDRVFCIRHILEGQLKGIKYNDIVIDNAELALFYILRENVVAMSINNDDLDMIWREK